MKKIIRWILFRPIFAKWLIKPILKLHSLTYLLAGLYGTMLNHGIHPKHDILKYKEWFVSHIKNNWVVLDVGCHHGLLSKSLAEKASFVYGIEQNKHTLIIAQKQHFSSNIEYIWADATQYDYTSIQPIHCVILSNVLEHIAHRVDFLKKLITTIKWADPSQKRFLIRVPMINRSWIVIYKKNMGLDYRLDSTHKTEYDFNQFENELKQANIRIISYDIRFGEIYAICISDNLVEK